MSIIEQLSVAESTISTEALVSDIPSTKDFVGLYRNSSEEICRYFDDLVNNDYHYHNNIVTNSEELILSDDSNYKNIPSIVDEVEDIISNPQKYIDGGTRLYRVPTDSCFTSDAKLGNGLGADRLWRFFKGSNHVKQYDERVMENGWCQQGSNPLTGFVRWVVDPWERVTGIVISKICGNGRHYMKLRSHGGQVADVIMMIDFHSVYTDMNYTNYQKIETESFVRDQQHQNPHDQSTKFIAGVKSGDKKWVELRNLFEKHDIDYDGVVSKTTNSVPNWNLGSFEGFSYGKSGKPGREIRHFGEDNFGWALNTLKEIQFTRSEGGAVEYKSGKGLTTLPQNELPNSALRAFIRAFHTLTEKFTDEETGRQIPPFCTKEDLKNILHWRYTKVNRSGEFVEYGLAELNQKDEFKDLYFVGISTFLCDVLNDLQGQGVRNNRVKSKHPAMRRYIESCSDNHMKNQARSIIDNRI